MHTSADRRMFQELAFFRHQLRIFLRFSEEAARACGITPQQHQLMLGIAGFTGTGAASISEIAEFLQEKHNSVVGLVDRAVQSGLVQRAEGIKDRRIVQLSLTAHGEEILRQLSLLHRDEVKRLRPVFLRTAVRSRGASPSARRKPAGLGRSARRKRASQ